ncbi:MAG: hypothetical protein ACOCXG_02895 [Nanoarchaeota archaeon]
MAKKEEVGFFELIRQNKRNMALIFLGVGLTLFALNISSLLSFYLLNKYDYANFDISTFGSMLIVILSTYLAVKHK